jgi:hypothetical protein
MGIGSSRRNRVHGDNAARAVAAAGQAQASRPAMAASEFEDVRNGNSIC